MRPAAANRVARAALVATALAVLSLAGHAAGGGGVDPVGLAIVVLLSGLLGAALAGRSLSWLKLTALLVAGQGLLHLMMTFTSSHAHAGGEHGASAMVIAHVCAAGLAALVIRNADDLIGRWASFLRAAIAAWRLAPARPALRTELLRQVRAAAVPSTTALHRGLRRRGPPVAPVFAT
jgi:hypothetical protein